ncbi:MAG: hypothetical protein PHN57_01215 [Candidatus Omnitrophica bacterium]|nr:hypothetical protein [Candidatus Omnitrophota bacterium]
MKKARLSLVISAAIVLIIFFSFKPAILFFAKQKLKDVFYGSAVYIGGCDFRPLGGIGFRGIEIKRGDIYDFKIDSFKIGYDLFSLSRGHVRRISFDGLKAAVNIPAGGSLDLKKYLNLKGGAAFVLDRVLLSNSDLTLKAGGLNFSCRISIEVDPIKRLVSFLDLKADSVDYGDLSFSGISAAYGKPQEPGYLRIDKIKAGKITLRSLSSKLGFKENYLSLDPLEAEIFDGKIAGGLNIRADNGISYSLSLKAASCNIETAIHDLNLDEKLSMTGLLTGDVLFKGKGQELEDIRAELGALSPGGRLSVKDTKLLENMAGNTQQPMDILVASFKDYHYNSGTIKVMQEAKDLVINVNLEGEAGKRNLTAAVHGFNLKDLLGKGNGR